MMIYCGHLITKCRAISRPLNETAVTLRLKSAITLRPGTRAAMREPVMEPQLPSRIPSVWEAIDYTDS